MKINIIQLGKRARLTLLELNRESMRHPLFLAVANTEAPEPPAGMSHDQAIGVEGDYKTAYQGYERKLQTNNNAALLGWAANINNLLTFADEDFTEKQLADEYAKVIDLYDRYGGEYKEFTGDSVIDYGIRILAVVIGLAGVDGKPLEEIRNWLSETYKNYGAIDTQKVDEAIKSEAGSA